MELTKSDLLKLVTYFEGEIQARDIAIAALKVFNINLYLSLTDIQGVNKLYVCMYVSWKVYAGIS